MPAAYLTSAKAYDDAVPSNLTTGNIVVAGSELYALALVFSADGAGGATPTACKWGGALGTPMVSVATITFPLYGLATLYELIAPTPATSSFYTEWPVPQGDGLLIGAVFSGVDPITPRAAPVQNSGSNNANLAVNVPCTVGQLIAGFGLSLEISGSSFTMAVTAPATAPQVIQTPEVVYETLGVSYRAAAANPQAMGWTLSGAISNEWRTIYMALNDYVAPVSNPGMFIPFTVPGL